MDIAFANFNPTKAIAINQCRLYLKVEAISDISNATGTKLQQQIRKGQLVHSNSLLTWPTQPSPSTTLWRIWRKFLQHIADDSNTLYQALGPWHNLKHRKWNYQYCQVTNTIQTPTGTVEIVTKDRTKWHTIPTLVADQEKRVPIDTFPHSLTKFSPPSTYAAIETQTTTWQTMLKNRTNYRQSNHS
jgi:hypothetical protein